MPDVIFPLDSSKKFEDQEKVGHNRWHPEIPPVATVKPGDSFRVHCGYGRDFRMPPVMSNLFLVFELL